MKYIRIKYKKYRHLLSIFYYLSAVYYNVDMDFTLVYYFEMYITHLINKTELHLWPLTHPHT